MDDFTKKIPKFLSSPPIQVYPIWLSQVSRSSSLPSTMRQSCTEHNQSSCVLILTKQQSPIFLRYRTPLITIFVLGTSFLIQSVVSIIITVADISCLMLLVPACFVVTSGHFVFRSAYCACCHSSANCWEATNIITGSHPQLSLLKFLCHASVIHSCFSFTLTVLRLYHLNNYMYLWREWVHFELALPDI